MSSLSHVDAGADWLAHHGIQGQKWGVQNGPPYPIPEGDHSSAEKKKMAKTYSKELNENDKKLAKEKRNYYDSVKKTNQITSKIDKLKSKKQTEARISKIKNLEAQKKESKKEEKAYYNNVQERNEYAEKYVENLEKAGFTVKEVATSRNVTKGSEYAGMVAMAGFQMLASVAGLPTLGIYESHSVSGTKYKVKSENK